VDQLVKPTLSDQQERDPGLLPAAVRVELDTTGNVIGVAVESSSGNPVVDAAIAEAARKTTYHPARFACQSERSSHVLRIDFSK
jgi:TonB family protein